MSVLYLVCLIASLVDAIKISEIQGTKWISPYKNDIVHDIRGVVTAIDTNRGFYMQDPYPDQDHRTSEGIYVFEKNMTLPKNLAIGSYVSIESARAVEFKFRARTNDANSITELKEVRGIQILKEDVPSITPFLLGEKETPTELIYAPNPFERDSVSIQVEEESTDLDLSYFFYS